MLKIKISLEIFHSFLIISLYFLKILSVISQKTLYNLSKSSPHILSFNLSLYSHSIIKIILTHDHLGMNFTFVLVFLQCSKMQLITFQNFHIQTCFSHFLWFFSLMVTALMEKSHFSVSDFNMLVNLFYLNCEICFE